ncbi:MAG: type II toxin-antitoxin system Phd/YefM family antitoxin [Rhodospirillales bacterium]|jgi:prevent-host-death family protein|nr:type II toxin-antitoxin system Phd/YefM family antitoxin [Rhodospirillales bacterium]
MNSIGAFEAKTHLSSLLEQVSKGETVVITRHGNAVAKLVPADQSLDKRRSAEAILRLKAFGQSRSLRGLDWKSLRDEGRM